jgi:hypothetical protein
MRGKENKPIGSEIPEVRTWGYKIQILESPSGRGIQAEGVMWWRSRFRENVSSCPTSLCALDAPMLDESG